MCSGCLERRIGRVFDECIGECCLMSSVTECVDINIIIMVDHNHRESDNSVGGTIKEEEEDVGYTDDCIEPIPEEERQEDASPKLMTHQKKTRKKPKANAWSSSQKKALIRDEKPVVKLYEQSPFGNPALERCRQNALNAKLNREKKKAAREQMEREVARLKSENARLVRAEAAAVRRAGEAEGELQRLRAQLRLSAETSVTR